MSLEFSFDAKKYRKDLADSLKEKRAESRPDAQELLKQERETLQYKVSEDIKRVLAKIEEKKGEKREAKEQDKEEATPEKLELKEISTEVLKMEGSDGVEHELELHTFDISNQIPDGVKMLYDMSRLLELDTKLSHTNIGPNTFKFSERETPSKKSMRTEHAAVILHHYLKSKLESVSSKLEGVPLKDLPEYKAFFKKDSEIGELVDQKYEDDGYEDSNSFRKSFDIAKLIEQRYDDFVNTITQGAMSDEKVFAHVVDANPGGYIVDLRQTPEKLENLENRYPHEHPEQIVQEKMLDIHDAKSRELWFSAGGAEYKNMFKIKMLCDSRNQRFKNEIKSVGTTSGAGAHTLWREYNRQAKGDQFETALLIAGHRSGNDVGGPGAHIDFKKDEPWPFIADWIIDTYHGRLYKITEKQEKKEEPA